LSDPTTPGLQSATPARRPRARRADGHLLRDDLINAGCQVLAECGDSQRLSLRAVAAAANVTPAAVYRHFPDRRALVAAIVASCFADFADTLNTGRRCQRPVRRATPPLLGLPRLRPR
jgi:AcrR family transcriptional regulator